VVDEVLADLERRGVVAQPFVRHNEREMRRSDAEDEEERLVAIVGLEITENLVGENVSLEALEPVGLQGAVAVDGDFEVAVEAFEGAPILEAGAVAFRGALTGATDGAGRRLADRGRDLVAHDAAVPLAEVGGAVAGSSQFGGQAGRGSFVDVEEAGDGAGVRVATREDRAPRGRADGAVGVSATEAYAPGGQAVESRRSDVGIAGVGHGLAAMLVGEHHDDVG